MYSIAQFHLLDLRVILDQLGILDIQDQLVDLV